MKKKLLEKIYTTFRALKYKNYRLFFWGQCISLVGTWIQQVAMSWLIYSLTKSALLMGIIAFTGSVPSIIVSPFAGVWIDRVNKHKALILVQIAFLVEALILALLTIFGAIQTWHIVLLSVVFGVIVAVDIPLRQSFIIELVDDDNDLGNAISLNSSSFNLARLIGPAIAGILISIFNEGICFMLNAISYIAVIWALIAMKFSSTPVIVEKKINVIKELKEGIEYSFNSVQIRNLLLFMAFASFIGMSYPVLMPIFAKEILNGNAQTLGFLMSSSGIGALVGALYLASRKVVSGLANWLSIAAISVGIGLSILGSFKQEFISHCTMFLIGFGVVIIIAACNTLIQHFVDDDKRGRVLSMYTIAFMGAAPIGSLFSGTVANSVGVQKTFIISGLAMIVAALVFATKLKLLNKTPLKEKLQKQKASTTVN